MTNETDNYEERDLQPSSDAARFAVIDAEELTVVTPKALTAPETKDSTTPVWKTFVAVPSIFITVALLGGLRLAAPDGDFVFFRPPLFCLIAAALLVVLLFRSRLITVDGWFSDRKTPLANVAGASVLVALFAATTQIFNALLPESGLPFWIFAFCFLWTLWNNLFADFDVRKLLKSLAALFGFAFVVKYLVLAAITSPAGDSSLLAILQNPLKEGATWLFDLPRYTPGTGYIQFFTVVFYLLGLSMLPPKSDA